MKLRFSRSTTPASVSFLGKSALVLVVIVMAFIAPLNSIQPAYADQYNDQINALQQSINSYNAQAAQLAGQASTLQAAIDSLQDQQNIIQAQIDLSQAQYDQLSAKIVATQANIKENQDALGQTLADMYVNNQVTPLEMLASSQNIGDYLNKQTYRNSISGQLTSTITQIQTLQAQLNKQQSDLKLVLGNEQNSENALASTQSQQQTLLNQTQGQESAYQQLISSDKAQQAALAAQQQAAMAAAFQSTGGATMIQSGAAASGGYPWNNSNCPMDGWLSTGGSNGEGGDGYGYGCRQCASYAAWRVDKETGYYPLNWGSAINFPASAAASGYAEGSTPRAGSLAIMSVATSGNANGHVAWVESVNSDGTITVSQYNANYDGIGWGNYSEMKMSPSLFYTYIYIE